MDDLATTRISAYFLSGTKPLFFVTELLMYDHANEFHRIRERTCPE
jgi:hypothetical protein